MDAVLQTERLKLCQTSINDAPALFSYWSDPEVTKFMNIAPFHQVDQAVEMIHYLTQLASERKAIRYSIFLKKTEQIIGSCGFNYFDYEHDRAEIAYDLGKDFWGHGFAAEAVRALLHHGFHDLNLNRIEAKVEPQNRNSVKLLSKLGFFFEGTLRQYEKSKGNFIDLQMYSKLKNEHSNVPISKA